MEGQAPDLDTGEELAALGFEDPGCALLIASAVAALVISLFLGPFGLIAFPIVFLMTLLLAAMVGMPLLLVAIWLRRANIGTAALAGFIAGAAAPAFLAWNYDGGWWGIAPFGAAGAIGGIVFWRSVTAPQRDRWE